MTVRPNHFNIVDFKSQIHIHVHFNIINLFSIFNTHYKSCINLRIFWNKTYLNWIELSSNKTFRVQHLNFFFSSLSFFCFEYPQSPQISHVMTVVVLRAGLWSMVFAYLLMRAIAEMMWRLEDQSWVVTGCKLALGVKKLEVPWWSWKMKPRKMKCWQSLMKRLDLKPAAMSLQ